jgi:ADP-ribose pyrophosphatase
VRELAEETGYRAAEWARAGILHNAIGYSNEGIEIWFARGLVPGEQRLDHNELLDVFALGLDEMEAMAARGELTDAKTLIGMLWLTQWRSGRWPLQWQPAPAAPV